MIRSRIVTLLLLSITVTLFVFVSAKTIIRKERNQSLTVGSASEEIASNDIWFEPKSAIHGFTAEGVRFSSETWESTDGIGIFLYRRYCDSSKTATEILFREVKDATVVFETGTLTNSNGEITGKRFIVSFDKQAPPQQLIFWTEGRMLYRVESSSFRHALLFEKLFPSL